MTSNSRLGDNVKAKTNNPCVIKINNMNQIKTPLHHHHRRRVHRFPH
jgi:hypothetical protein